MYLPDAQLVVGTNIQFKIMTNFYWAMAFFFKDFKKNVYVVSYQHGVNPTSKNLEYAK